MLTHPEQPGIISSLSVSRFEEYASLLPFGHC
nr:MAG TPA: hypothetical protein [Caudoviricetes sp.]